MPKIICDKCQSRNDIKRNNCWMCGKKLTNLENKVEDKKIINLDNEVKFNKELENDVILSLDDKKSDIKYYVNFGLCYLWLGIFMISLTITIFLIFNFISCIVSLIIFGIFWIYKGKCNKYKPECVKENEKNLKIKKPKIKVEAQKITDNKNKFKKNLVNYIEVENEKKCEEDKKYKDYFLEQFEINHQIKVKINEKIITEGLINPQFIENECYHIECGTLKLTINGKEISLENCIDLTIYIEDKNQAKRVNFANSIIYNKGNMKPIKFHDKIIYNEEDLKNSMVFVWKIKNKNITRDIYENKNVDLFYFRGNELKLHVENIVNNYVNIFEYDRFIYTLNDNNSGIYNHILYNCGNSELLLNDANKNTNVSINNIKLENRKRTEEKYKIIDNNKINIYFSVDGSKTSMIMEKYYYDKKCLSKLENIFDDDFSLNYHLQIDLNDLKSLEFLFFLSGKYDFNLSIYGIPIPELLTSLEGKENKLKYDSFFYSEKQIENYKELIKEIYAKYNEDYNPFDLPRKFPYPVITAEQQREVLMEILSQKDPIFKNYFDRNISPYISHKDYNAILPKMKQIYNDIYEQLIIDGKFKHKWFNELNLFKIAKSEYPDTIYQFRSNWLGNQSLDIYIPDLNLAIEYQGMQHYEPVKAFGGKEKFEERLKLDNRKRQLCKENSINLFEWKYDLEVNKLNFKRVVNKYK